MKTLLLFCAFTLMSVKGIEQTAPIEQKGLTPEELEIAIQEHRNMLMSPAYLKFEKASMEFFGQFNVPHPPLSPPVNLVNWLKVNWQLTEFKSALDAVLQWNEVERLRRAYQVENMELFKKMFRSTPDQVDKILAPLLERNAKRSAELMEKE